MINIVNIFEGWKNVLFRTKEIEAVAYNRAAICSKCEYSSEHKVFCTKCNCPLIAKLRSMGESCPENKWQQYTKSKDYDN